MLAFDSQEVVFSRSSSKSEDRRKCTFALTSVSLGNRVLIHIPDVQRIRWIC